MHDSEAGIQKNTSAQLDIALEPGHAWNYQLANRCDTRVAEVGTTIAGCLRELARLVWFLSGKTVREINIRTFQRLGAGFAEFLPVSTDCAEETLTYGEN